VPYLMLRMACCVCASSAIPADMQECWCRGPSELAGGACPAALLARAAALQEHRARASAAAPGARDALEASVPPAPCAPDRIVTYARWPLLMHCIT